MPAPTPFGYEPALTDLFRIPGMSATRIRRQCVNPLCKKSLSALNKRDLCFCCSDQMRMNRLSVPNYVAPASLPRRA